MYKNRKRMLLVGGASAAVLAAFGVGSWAIIEASKKVPLDDSMIASLSGSTLNNKGNVKFLYGQMSISDWMFYSMPQFSVETTVEGVKTVNYYSDLDFLITNGHNYLTQEKLDNNDKNLLYSIRYHSDGTEEVITPKRNSVESITLVTTSIEDKKIVNKYYWGETQVLDFSGSSPNFSYDMETGYSLKYSHDTTGSKETYSTSLITNANHETWKRTYIPQSSASSSDTNSKNFSIEYRGNMNADTTPITQTFTHFDSESISNSEKETTTSLPYYKISYTAGTNNTPINDNATLLSRIKYDYNDKNNTFNCDLKLGDMIGYMPMLFKKW